MEATSRAEGGVAAAAGGVEEEEGPLLSDAELDRMLLDWVPEGEGEEEGEDGGEGAEVLGEGVKAGVVVHAESSLVSGDAVEGQRGSSAATTTGGAEGRVLEHLLAPKAAPSQEKEYRRPTAVQSGTASGPAFSADSPSAWPQAEGAESEESDDDDDCDDLLAFENPLDDLLPAASPFSPPPSLPSTSLLGQRPQQGSRERPLVTDFGQASVVPPPGGGAASAAAAGPVLAQIQQALQAGASPEELKRLIDQAFAATTQGGSNPSSGGSGDRGSAASGGGGSGGGNPAAAASASSKQAGPAPAASSQPRVTPRAPPPPRAAGPARPPPVPPSDDPLLQLRPEIRRQLEGEAGPGGVERKVAARG